MVRAGNVVLVCGSASTGPARDTTVLPLLEGPAVSCRVLPAGWSVGYSRLIGPRRGDHRRGARGFGMACNVPEPGHYRKAKGSHGGRAIPGQSAVRLPCATAWRELVIIGAGSESIRVHDLASLRISQVDSPH
jgi:hypothetical protein